MDAHGTTYDTVSRALDRSNEALPRLTWRPLKDLALQIQRHVTAGYDEAMV